MKCKLICCIIGQFDCCAVCNLRENCGECLCDWVKNKKDPKNA